MDGEGTWMDGTLVEGIIVGGTLVDLLKNWRAHMGYYWLVKAAMKDNQKLVENKTKKFDNNLENNWNNLEGIVWKTFRNALKSTINACYNACLDKAGVM